MTENAWLPGCALNILFFPTFRTSGENIGDTGLVQAYRAWEAQYESSHKAGNEYLLPGLDKYTREQLFFISFARVWARKMKPAAAVSDPNQISSFDRVNVF